MPSWIKRVTFIPTPNLFRFVYRHGESPKALDTFKNFLAVPFLKGARGEAKETVPLILEQAG